MRTLKYNKDHASAVDARARVLDIIDSIDPADLVVAIKNAPSLRGMILGYIAEVMFQKHILEPHAKISKIREFDDHNRQENKADRAFELDGKIITVQLKSIQTTTIKWDNLKNCLTANVQNDGSDKRDVKLPNGNTVSTTNYRVGDYDILAVPLFPYTGKWDFAYKLNRDCRLTVSSKYNEDDRKYLLATTEVLTFPVDDDWEVSIDEICKRL